MSQLLRDSREMIEHVEKDIKVGLSLDISQGRLLREGFYVIPPKPRSAILRGKSAHPEGFPDIL